jgi:hypothetical protein
MLFVSVKPLVDASRNPFSIIGRPTRRTGGKFRRLCDKLNLEGFQSVSHISPSFPPKRFRL